MFNALVRKNRENNPNLFKKEVPSKTIRLAFYENADSYTAGLAVIIANFENSRYFWYLLSDWSRVWHPTTIKFDVVIFKEFEDGTILTEFCGLPDLSTIGWVGDTKVLHTDPADTKFTLRIYQCNPQWNPTEDKPAAYIAPGYIVPNSIVKLIASQTITGETDKKFFFEIIDNYRKYHGVGPESVLENFWYTIWGTSCSLNPVPEPIEDTLSQTETEKSVYYRQLFDLRHRGLVEQNLRERSKSDKITNKEVTTVLDRYWKVLTGTDRKREEYFRYLDNESLQYQEFYNKMIPKPVIVKVTETKIEVNT